ncbi:hypothetical protein [Pseudolysinimonas sp.]
MSGFAGLGGSPDVQCSAAGCTATASWRVNWRNPRIHAAERVKVWLGCTTHRDTLRDYLATRGFPVLVSPLDVPVELVPEANS